MTQEIAVKDARIAELEAELDYAAKLIDCKCGKRDLVLNELRELGSLHAENLCPKDQSCLAILAAELRAVKEGKKNA